MKRFYCYGINKHVQHSNYTTIGLSNILLTYLAIFIFYSHFFVLSWRTQTKTSNFIFVIFIRFHLGNRKQLSFLAELQGVSASYLRCLIFSVYNNSGIIFKNKSMSQYNISQMKDLDTYGDHLFYLDNKGISFFTEQAQELKKGIETKVSSLDKSTNYKISLLNQSIPPYEEDHFVMSFINEHELILQKYIKNYKELFDYKQEGVQNITPQLQSPSHSHDTLERTFKIIQETSSHFNKEEIVNVSNQILKHHRLNDFLRMILKQYPLKISCTLVKITCRIWLEYSKGKLSKLTEREIIEETNRMLTFSFLKKVNELLGVTLRGCDFPKLKSFLNVFTNTILFIANQFFMNPYYQLEEQLTLQQFQTYELYLYDQNIFQDDSEEEGEDELQEAIKGRKMIKRQTFF